MESNYAKIVKENMDKLYSNLPDDLDTFLPAVRKDNAFKFSAFGGICVIQPDGIFIDGQKQDDAIGILVSLYALHASSEACILKPFKAFKEFPDSMPYVGAFTTHTEQLLVPHVSTIKESANRIIKKLKGQKAPVGTGGDFSFLVYPLPKIALCYIFYEADDDFPASVTCLYSNNARQFLPVDGLADVGEYCSKTLLDLIK